MTSASAARGCGRRFHERLLRLVENGEEDRLLIREMMVEGALGDAGADGDVLDERPRVAADAKELSRHGQELATRRLGPLLLGRHRATVAVLTYPRPVCRDIPRVGKS